jgi:N-acyl-D-aspartate/D-glutamate deacylase
VTCRPIVQQVTMSEPTAFYVMGAFSELVALPPAARPELWADRGWRARARADIDRSGLLATRWETTRVAESPSRPELAGRSLGALARERGVSPWDALCDVAVEDGLRTRIEITFANDDEEGVAALLRADGCVLGLSDAGAHVSQICDAVMPTDFLARWVRDRKLMPLEAGIHKLTGEVAQVLGLERGVLREGAPADVAVLDWDALDPGPVRRVRDMPGGGERLVADAPRGVVHVLVNGVPIRERGADSAAGLARRPGTILRS